MKPTLIKRLLILPLLFIAGAIIAQPPPAIPFQAVAKDPLGNPAKNRKVFVKDIITQSTPGGTKVWEEAWEVSSNDDGIFTIVIGQGTKSLSIPIKNIGEIDWANGPYFINYKVAVAPSIPAAWWIAADNYLDMGTTQLMSTAYALFAGNASVTNVTTSIQPGDKETFLYTDSLGHVAWTKPQFVNVSISNVTESIKPGDKGTFLTTDSLGNVAWTTPQAANVNVTQISNNVLKLNPITAQGQNAVIAGNTTTLVVMDVPGAEVGDPVIVTALGDYKNFNVYSTWIDTPNKVNIRFSNFQKVAIPVSGNLYKIVIVK